MEVVTDLAGMRGRSREFRRNGRAIGFVPTMGALHAGHLSLVARARERSQTVVLSVFVNPAQFAPGEDYEMYPRVFERDCALALEAGVDVLFAPAAAEMYPPGASTKVEVGGISEILCGAFRPGHFKGVATVVLKLFQIVEPDVAVFGQKDYQQSVVIRRMVRDLNLPVAIDVAPIVREPDGLALSSRNVYLSPDERRAALVLSRSLDEAARSYVAGERDAVRMEAAIRSLIEAQPRARIDYIAIADPESLEPLARIADPPETNYRPGPAPRAVIALAVWIGATRLLDNILLP